MVQGTQPPGFGPEQALDVRGGVQILLNGYLALIFDIPGPIDSAILPPAEEAGDAVTLIE
jgi:hypothetical protein